MPGRWPCGVVSRPTQNGTKIGEVDKGVEKSCRSTDLKALWNGKHPTKDVPEIKESSQAWRGERNPRGNKVGRLTHTLGAKQDTHLVTNWNSNTKHDY
jgi:hypothetical protein